MSDGGLSKEGQQSPLTPLQKANLRFTEALAKQTSGISRFDVMAPDERYATVIFSELKKTLSSPAIDSSFRSEFERFLDPPSSGSYLNLEFATEDNRQLWSIRAHTGTYLTIEKYEDGRGSALNVSLKRGSLPTSLKYSEGAANDRQDEITEDSEPIIGASVGPHAFLMFDELAPIFKDKLIQPPLRPLIENLQSEDIPRKKIPYRTALDPEGELDEDFNRIPRFRDIMHTYLKGASAEAEELIDWEDPRYRGLSNESELDAWLTWQKEHKFRDEDAKEHSFEEGRTYHFLTRNERGEDVQLAVRVESKEGMFHPRYVHVRELKETNSAELEDCGEVTSVTGLHASTEWRAPGVDSDNNPTTISSMGRTKGDKSINPLTKWERAYAMLKRGRLIGFEGGNGGIVPVFRSPKKT